VTTDATTHDLGNDLAAALPPLGEEDRRRARAVARALAQAAAPLDRAALADALERPGDAADAEVASLPWVVRDDGDRVVGFWGLSVLPTPHRLGVAGNELFAFCAMDALYLPWLVGEAIAIESSCPTTGEPITLTASAEGISDVSPAGAAVSFRIPAEGFSGSSSQVIENACHFTHFFVSDGAAEEWARERDRMAVVSIDRAFELARDALAANLVPAR
jgi:alkylmercury lyase